MNIQVYSHRFKNIQVYLNKTINKIVKLKSVQEDLGIRRDIG